MQLKTKSNLPDLFVFIVILLFVIVKLPALQLPYFWDELGVYAQAGLYMHDHNLSLLPNALPPELSRGHPLLFTIIQGVGFRLFGDTVVGGHLTALIISIVLLWSVYKITSTYFKKNTALLSVMLLIVQPMFYAQSVLILPEICLALFVLWAMYFWIEKKYFLHGLFATLAILVKETAIIIPCVIIVSEGIIYLLSIRNKNKIYLKVSQLFTLLPIVIFGIFLLIQKQQNGWYLFPLHQENLTFSMNKLLEFSGNYFLFLIFAQGRICYSIMALLLIFFIILNQKIVTPKFTILLIILILGGISFNSLNFYMNRYLLFVLVPAVILFSRILIQVAEKQKWVLFSLPFLFFISLYHLNGNTFFKKDGNNVSLQQKFMYDENMSYTGFLKAQDEAVDFVLKIANPNDSIFSNFPVAFALLDTRFGYTTEHLDEDFSVIKGKHIDDNVSYAILSEPGSYDYTFYDKSHFTIIKTIRNPYVNIDIYARN